MTIIWKWDRGMARWRAALDDGTTMVVTFHGSSRKGGSFWNWSTLIPGQPPRIGGPLHHVDAAQAEALAAWERWRDAHARGAS